MDSPHPAAPGATTLSVIVAAHRGVRVESLDEALFALAIQDGIDLDVRVAVERPDAPMAEARDGQPWPQTGRCEILVATPRERDNVRSVLLNAGLEHATGTHVMFLDPDLIVYPHGCAALIRSMQESRAAICVGACRRAWVGGEGSLLRKDTPDGRTYTRDEWISGTAPTPEICVFDRRRLAHSVLRFDQTLPGLEEEELFLRVLVEEEPEIVAVNAAVAERRVAEGRVPPPECAAARAEIERRRRFARTRIGRFGAWLRRRLRFTSPFQP